jgi:hypothetical protein
VRRPSPGSGHLEVTGQGAGERLQFAPDRRAHVSAQHQRRHLSQPYLPLSGWTKIGFPRLTLGLAAWIRPESPLRFGGFSQEFAVKQAKHSAYLGSGRKRRQSVAVLESGDGRASARRRPADRNIS